MLTVRTVSMLRKFFLQFSQGAGLEIFLTVLTVDMLTALTLSMLPVLTVSMLTVFIVAHRYFYAYCKDCSQFLTVAMLTVGTL